MIKFIIIFILIFWAIRILLRFVFPLILRELFGTAQQQSNGQSRRSRPEGTISIDYIPKKERKGNTDKLGDFVDYEEIK